jgi:preprotein translocase subunit SecD
LKARRHIILLVTTVTLIVVTFVATLLSSNRPVLGLDLQGGISIVLVPVKGSDLSTLGTAADIIRSRVDGLGIAEPDVNTQGGDVVVDLPGVKDRCRAEALVGETAQLEFRPVVGTLPWGPSTAPTTTTTTVKGAKTTTTVKGGATPTTVKGSKVETSTTKGALATRVINAKPIVALHRADATTTSNAPTTTTSTSSTTKTATTTDSSGCPSVATGGTATTTTTTPPTTSGGTSTTKGALPTRRIAAVPIVARHSAGGTSTPPTAAPKTKTTAKATPPPTTQSGPTNCENGALVTPRRDPTLPPLDQVVYADKADKHGNHVVCYVLGKQLMTGNAIGSAKATLDPTQGWLVQVSFKNDDFVNKVAKQYVNQQVAIALDSVVQSAPTIQPGITGRDVQITGNFSGGEASNLALVLRYGSLPLQFDNTQRTVQSVSPTLGKDQLRAGIIAGVIGLILVALYMIFFYRLLGLVVWFGLALTGMTFYTLLTWLSVHRGLTLTLAGVTGIIVSVGITVDSYVVFFERLKDEVRTGKTIRSSLETSWKRAWRTIIAADAVSLIGAVVLYLFAVSSVRGFAFFLGMSTILDLVLAACYMHPCVVLLSRRPHLVRMPGFGIAVGLDVPGVPA